MADLRSDVPVSRPRLILASASPRRAELLREHGYEFEIIRSPLPEPVQFLPGLSPLERAEASSEFKARSVAKLVAVGWVLAADTIASLGGRIFGKPADRDDARRILQALWGTTHQVITGVTLLDASNGATLIRHDSTDVTMRRLSEREIEDYLDSGAWEGKAGAYGIQDQGDAFVERIDGSFTNVVGLPMELLAKMLHAFPRRSSNFDL